MNWWMIARAARSAVAWARDCARYAVAGGEFSTENSRAPVAQVDALFDTAIWVEGAKTHVVESFGIVKRGAPVGGMGIEG